MIIIGYTIYLFSMRGGIIPHPTQGPHMTIEQCTEAVEKIQESAWVDGSMAFKARCVPIFGRK